MLFPAGVHFITDRRRSGGRPLEWVVEQAVAGGVAAVHLRDPELPDAELLLIARKLRQLTAGRCALVVNDRLAVARAVGADAVQLGWRSVPVAGARQLASLPDAGRLLIGRSVHSVKAAEEAARQGADYLLLGTLYATASHPGHVPAGVELVDGVCAAVRIPAVGIGGITPANAREVIRAGATGVAVISAISESSDVEEAAHELVHVVSEAISEREARGLGLRR